jgi:hypothetical protein
MTRKQLINIATTKIDRLQRQFDLAQERVTRAEESFIEARDKNEGIANAIFRLTGAKAHFNDIRKTLGDARKELEGLMQVRAIEEEDDSGDEWSDSPVINGSGGGEVLRVRAMLGGSQGDEAVEEEKEDAFIDEESEPEEESKEDDSLFVEDDESEETSEVNAGFQGEFILVIPDGIDNKIFIVSENKGCNESKEEIERMLLEEKDAKILYEASPYNALLLEHVLTMPVSMNLFNNVDYEGMLLKA